MWSVLGKDRVMQSWLWQAGRDEGEVQGEARGRAQALRQVCADLAKELHPRVAERVLPAIDACDQPETLRAWILQCPKLTGAAFAALVTGSPERVVRSRTSRPSRTSRRRATVRRVR